MVWLTIIGSASIQIRADDKYFEPDVQRAVKRIKNVAIQLKADVDLTKATKKIRDLRYRITSKDAVLKVDANVEKAEAKLAKLLAKFIDKNMEFTATANTQGANTKLTELRDRFKNYRLPFTAQADTAAARSALNYAARNRTSTIRARIDPVTMGALQGLFNTLTGTLPFDKIKASIAGVSAHFEGLATKGTALVAVLGALSAAVLTTGANILSIGGDITQVIGLAGLFPAALFGVVTAVKATTMAWKGFGDAMKEAKTPAQLKEQQEALAKLPPEAQAAVKALREVRGEVQKPVQAAYWEAMGTSLQDMVSAKLPEFKRGMTEVGGAMGRYTASALDAIANTSSFEGVFNDITTSIDNMAKGLTPAIEGLKRWIDVGATYLPQFGNWVSDLSTKFAAWTKNAQETGQMNVWIDTSIQRIQELGSIVKSTTGFFSGLTNAARMAGAPGLTEMAAGMRNIRDIVNGEPFQSRLTTILEGARTGTKALGEGFKELTSLIGDSSLAVSIFLDRTGQVAGTALSSVRALFEGTNLGGGLVNALKGLDDALVIMEPGFADLGNAIGHLGDVAAELFRNMAPGLNQLFETVEGVLAALKDGIIVAMPVFNEFVQAILTLVQGPVIFLAEQIGNVLKAFADLPGAIQTVMMSLGLLLLLKGKFTNFFAGMGRSLQNEKTGIGQAFAGIRDGANTTKMGVAGAFSDLGANIKNTLVTSAEASSKAFSPIIGRAQDAADRTKSAFSGVGTALREGMRIGPELDTVKTGFQNLSTSVTQTARGMGENLRSVGSDIARAIVPAGVRESATRFHNDLAPARQAFANLVPAAADAGERAGRALGGGIARASSGLLGALGGGWGAALGGATIALGLYAQALAESDARVSSFAKSLDQSTGAITEYTKRLVAESALDGATNGWDDFFRGVIQQSSSVEEALAEAEISLQDYTDRLSDPSGRDAYVKGMDTISNAMRDGIPITDEMAASIGTTKEALKGVTGNTMRRLADESKSAAEELAKAEKEVKDLAAATGTSSTQAAALAANIGVLRDASSSASAKFSALKGNLDILNDGFRSARDAARDQAETMLDLGDNLTDIAGKYGGLVEGTTKVNRAFQDSILNKETGLFSTATRGAIDFSREMDNVADSILRAGASEFDAVLKKTGDLSQAQSASLKVMNAGTEQLRQSLLNAGYDADIVNGIIANLKLNPDDLQGALRVETGEAEAAIARVKLSAAALASGNFAVALTALSEDAKAEILKTTEYAEAYKNGGWDAVIGLIDESGPGIEEFILKIQEANGDKSKINAILDAEFKGRGVIQEASTALDNINTKPMDVKQLEAIDGVTPVTETASAALRGISEAGPVTAEIQAIDNTLPARESALVTMDIPDSEAFLFGVDGTAPGRDSAQITMNGLQDVWRTLTSQDGAAPGVAAAQGTMNSLSNVARWLEAVNKAGDGKSAAQATIDLLKGKTVELKANDNASGVVDSVNKKGIADKSFNIIGVLSGVSAAVRSALGMANGGIMKGGVQKFADGGILNNIRTPQIKAYAGGGVENHVAQIAKGAWPVRIWAEPETGGEAYLPLGKNKRKRSLEILRQVMQEFGLGHLAQFADGGIMSSMNSSSRGNTFNGPSGNSGSVVTSSARGGAGAPIIVTNVYPSQGLDEEQVATSVSENIYWKLTTQI